VAATVPQWHKPKNFFTQFIDLIFTSFIERPFTNVFIAPRRLNVAACLYRARNAD
jgi:hypothetical protein